MAVDAEADAVDMEDMDMEISGDGVVRSGMLVIVVEGGDDGERREEILAGVLAMQGGANQCLRGSKGGAVGGWIALYGL